MEYIRCKSCNKEIASYNKDTITKGLVVQCKSCKAYNVINNNKAESFYIKIGESGNANRK